MIRMHRLGSILLALLGLTLFLGQARAEKPFASYPQAARDRYVQAEEMRAKAQYKEALTAFDEAVHLGLEGYARVYLNRAECHRQMRDHAKVVAEYTRLIEDLGIERSCWVCMVSSLRGRSAAYVALGDLERALADLTTVVALHEQDLAVRLELKAGDLTEGLRETAKAHRDRARVLMDRERWPAARLDVDRAEELERQVSAKPAEKHNAWIRLVNAWDKPVTVEVDGATHELQAGQEKKWRRAGLLQLHGARGRPTSHQHRQGRRDDHHSHLSAQALTCRHSGRPPSCLSDRRRMG